MKSNTQYPLIVSILLGLSLGTPMRLFAQSANSGASHTGYTMKDLPQCKKEFRTAPPLWVTVTGYDAENDRNAKINKNYMIGEQKDSTQPFIVPKRSIVQLHPQSQALLEELEQNPKRKISQDALVGVRVLSIPPESTKLQESSIEQVKKIANYRDHLRDKRLTPQFAKPGSTGYLKLNDLERIKDQKGYIFMLKKDSPLLKKIAEDTGEEDVALELAQENGKYIVNHCCNTEGICRDFAIYRALHPKNGAEIKTNISLEAECESCLANESIPMKKDFMKPLQGLIDVFSDQQRKLKASISQFNFVDSRGFVQLPVSEQDKSTGYKKGPFGSVQYTPEAGNADIYLKPEVACGFSQLLKAWQKNHCHDGAADCRIEFGNASHAYYQGSTGDRRWPHNTHSSGECIDIRPSYKQAAGGGRNFNSKNFDLNKFRNFMQLASELGPDTCFTTNRTINQEFRNSANCAYDKDHDDHLHICFPSKNGSKLNEKLMNACLNGVK